MEKVESIRERLLSRLPQTDDLAAYKEEVAVLLAKHKRALYWDGMGSKVIGAVSVALWLLSTWVSARDPHSLEPRYLLGLAFLASIVATVQGARYEIVKGQLELLKEIKQIQLQMLELQTSMRKSDGEGP
jgi:hypothetical protein